MKHVTRYLPAVMLVLGVAGPGMAQTIAPAPDAEIKPVSQPTEAEPVPTASTASAAPEAAPAPSRLDRLSALGVKPDWLKLQAFHQTMTRA